MACSQLPPWIVWFFFLTGLFNIGNRLLVSMDLFLRVRASIKLGHPLSQAARSVLDHVPNHPGKYRSSFPIFGLPPLTVYFLWHFFMCLPLCISAHTESRWVISNPRAPPEWLLGLRVSDSARLQRYDLRDLWCCSQAGDCAETHQQRAGAEECGGERVNHCCINAQKPTNQDHIQRAFLTLTEPNGSLPHVKHRQIKHVKKTGVCLCHALSTW